MQAIPGGAAAQPFKTFHKALGCDFYLRIALELYHKRLLVGGIDKLFEIGKNFRNEGLSRKHNPEFTMLEAYCAYGDYESMMETVEALIVHVAEAVVGTLEIPRGGQKSQVAAAIDRAVEAMGMLSDQVLASREPGKSESNEVAASHRKSMKDCREVLWSLRNSLANVPPLEVAKNARNMVQSIQSGLFLDQTFIKPLVEHHMSYWIQIQDAFKRTEALLKEESVRSPINLKPPWRRARYKDLVREKAGPDWFDISPAERRQRAHDLGAEIGKDYEDFEITGAVFEKLIEPTLIQPTFVTLLPKELVPLAKLSPDDPTTVEVFELCINGQEIAPGYTEQNNPIEQRERLEHQAGGEQQKLDEDFLVALEHGMPPAGGMGLGIDRLCMMLLGQESIRDVILFPQLKPK